MTSRPENVDFHLEWEYRICYLLTFIPDVVADLLIRSHYAGKLHSRWRARAFFPRNSNELSGAARHVLLLKHTVYHPNGYDKGDQTLTGTRRVWLIVTLWRHRSVSTLALVILCLTPLPEPILTPHNWASVAFTSQQFHSVCRCYYPV